MLILLPLALAIIYIFCKKKECVSRVRIWPSDSSASVQVGFLDPLSSSCTDVRSIHDIRKREMGYRAGKQGFSWNLAYIIEKIFLSPGITFPSFNFSLLGLCCSHAFQVNDPNTSNYFPVASRLLSVMIQT